MPAVEKMVSCIFKISPTNTVQHKVNNACCGEDNVWNFKNDQKVQDASRGREILSIYDSDIF